MPDQPSFTPYIGSKREAYSALLPSLEALVRGEPDLTANLANVMAALRDAMGFHWVGIYRVVPANGTGAGAFELVLGPFQGPVACTRIGFGKGVCGTCWQRRETIVVPDVNTFPGHIACSPLSRSEIVLPVFHRGEVAMVLDVDSDRPGAFDDADRDGLQRVVTLIESML